MKAMFVTTDTVDCLNHVKAWNSCFPKAAHLTFKFRNIRADHLILEEVERVEPDVIFYIGAVEGLGVPRIETLQAMRSMAKTINICSDAQDHPWHGVLKRYRREGCFDLQVSIDGAKDAPVDLSTLTPVDPSPFANREKDIRCGFSGTVGRWNTRSEIVNALEWFGGLKVRRREECYDSHGDFVSRCTMLLNTSWTGTMQAHHIKGRVLEAGFAGCALLEHVASPIADWFPEGCWIPWETPKDVADIIANATDNTIQSAAQALSSEVKRKYTAKHIYQEMLDYVDLAIERTATEHQAADRRL